jgi:subtilisin family serine protease
MNLSTLFPRFASYPVLIILLLIGLTSYGSSQIATSSNQHTVTRGERPPVDLAVVPVDAYESGVVVIRFHEGYTTHLEKHPPIKLAPGVIKFSIPALDDLLERYVVNDAAQHFSHPAFGNVFTEKHKAWGLHLWYRLKLDESADIKNLIVQLNVLDEIACAEPAYKKMLIGSETMIPFEEGTVPSYNPSPSWTPNDPQFSSQWHYYNTGQAGGTPGSDIRLTDAWDVEKGNSDVIVAIVDDGIQFNHPDISGNMWSGTGYNFVTGSNTIQPGNHGTHVAGTVAAVNNNGIGVAGVAGGSGNNDGVRLMSCQVFSGNGNGGFHLAPVWAADNGASISQNSWGYTSAGVYEQSVLDAIDYFNVNGGGNALLGGGITIFAAGNSNASGAWYPAFYSGAFAVAATNNQDIRSYYSNYGTWIDVSAPGGETNSVNARGVLSTVTGGSYAYYQGTSMACPHTSGVAALVISHAYGQLTPGDVADIIRVSADNHYAVNPGYVGQLGTGRINAYQALIETQAYLSGIPNPAAFSATTISATKISLSWVKNTENHNVMIAWSSDNTFGIPDSLVSYQAGDLIPGGGFVLYSGSGDNYLHEELFAATPYFYRAWSYTSSWHYSTGRPAAATTSCEVYELPFAEDFDTFQGIPLCWAQEPVTGSAQWNFGTGNGGSNPANAYNGISNLYFKEQAIGSTGITTRLVSPEMNLGNYDEVELRFWYTNQLRTWLIWNFQDILRIKFKTSATAAWQEIATYNTNIANWTEVVLSLPNITGTYYLAFEAESGLGHGVCIDHVTITGTGGQIIHTIQAIAGGNGLIEPSGQISVIENEDQSFVIVADTGFLIESLLVDDTPVEEAEGEDSFDYTFYNITQSHTIIASFAPRVYSIEVAINPENAGVVEGSDDYSHNEEVELLAIPFYGYTFYNWTEDGIVISTSNYLTFNAMSDRLLTANFAFETWSIGVTVDPPGTGTVEGDGEYQHTSVIELLAIPEEDYHFLGWFEDDEVVASENPYSFMANGNRDLIARFQITSASITNAEYDYFRVYPNPSTGYFRIDLDEPSSIRIFDLSGKVIFSSNEIHDKEMIDISGSGSGVYILHLQNSVIVSKIKLIVL